MVSQCGTENAWNRRQDTHCGNCGLTPAIGYKSSPSSDVSKLESAQFGNPLAWFLHI